MNRMRLIDADSLKLGLCKECTLYPDKCLKEKCDWDSIYHIENEKTIEAIPIEWIEKQIKKQMEQEQWELDAYGGMLSNGFCIFLFD